MKRIVMSLATAVGVVALAAGTATGAQGTEEPAAAGWARLAHLSPDTPEVDVSLTGLDGESVLELQDVGYGDVSNYARLPAGTYTAAMRPAGAPADSEPVITAAVEIQDGVAITVAAVGMNADLSGRILVDDLTAPAAGQARVRLISAAVSSPSVTVTTDTGTVLADDTTFGTATDYTEVPGGRWTLAISSDAGTGSTDVDLAAGSVNTLVVLDVDGELNVIGVVDSTGTPESPAGGMRTGGRGLDAERSAAVPAATLGLAVLLLAGAGAGAGAWVRRAA
ncbi:DUF4397 domain-containing protein [Jiangella rhizosphaerae]|uniref:DUF4397 domain-containing protein n=1 Tax=Jiangella rhizosphaerae TaxID=2293569 RepID=A0A418KTX5_9ACTN|nr:DUF4397 domain-containing protein [Jiangella rhizosphaerae]RIQ30999.1 DUF4397 domain-containing protein [Jiangella rhizosphaerae]